MDDWKFDLDEVGPEGKEVEDTILPPVEPKSPQLENIIPFLLGIGAALLVFFSLF